MVLLAFLLAPPWAHRQAINQLDLTACYEALLASHEGS